MLKVVPVVLHGCEAWILNTRSGKMIAVLEIKCLQTGVRWFDKVRNSKVSEICGNWHSLLERADEV